MSTGRNTHGDKCYKRRDMGERVEWERMRTWTVGLKKKSRERASGQREDDNEL